MKLSFMTFACPKWSAEEAIAGAKRHGYDGIEWRMDGGHAHGVELSLSDAGRAELRQKLADSGIASACLATSLKFVNAQSVAETPARLDLAAQIGAPGLRVFCGPLPEGVTLDDAISRVSENLSQVAELAKERSVGLWLETHDSMNRAAPVAAVLSRVAHPSVAANWDNMHPFFNGETFAETRTFLHGRIAHTHFHDAHSADPSTIVPFGDGGLPCAEMLAFLKSENFDGYLSGEWFNEKMGATPDNALANYIGGLKKLLNDVEQ